MLSIATKMGHPLIQLRRIARIVNGGTPTSDTDNWIPEVPWATPIDLGHVHGGYIRQTSRSISRRGVETGSTMVPAGSVLVSSRAPIGYIAISARPMAFNQGCKAVVPLIPQQDSPSFLRYSLMWAGDQLQSLGQGSTFLEISGSSLAGVNVPRPTPREQAQIADFLDHETAEIDAFIADQQRLIDLLTERRAATITGTLSTGLDGGAAEVDQRIPWLQTVPGGWPVRRLSHLFGLIGSGTTPPQDGNYYDPTGTRWVTTGELRETGITSTQKCVSDEARVDFPSLRVYPVGTLLIAMYGATIGRLGWLEEPATTNQACCAFAEPHNVLTRYVMYTLVAAREHLMLLASGGGQPNINQEKLRAFRIPVPTMREQRQIITDLDSRCAEIDNTVSDARTSIALSKERRAALISAAVTGKIDVRDWKRPEHRAS